MRYYRLDRTDGGDLPQESNLHVGSVIRVRGRNSRKPGPEYNPHTGDWVILIWVECDDPSAVK